MSAQSAAATPVAVLYPGMMGASVAAAAGAGGAPVVWASQGRSAATRSRAASAGCEDLGTLDAVCARAATIISVCPPQAAPALAARVAAAGFTGVFVDANAVSPETVGVMAAAMARSGAEFVDGALIGPPATQAGTTRLYLSGEAAERIARLFRASKLEPVVVGVTPGTASSLKMCYAAWTKGSAALLLATRVLARRLGVDEALRAEWQRSQPGLAERSEQAACSTAAKAWRFVAEMDEIAASFAAADLPDGFHAASAAIYRALEAFKDGPVPAASRVFDAIERARQCAPAGETGS